MHVCWFLHLGVRLVVGEASVSAPPHPNPWVEKLVPTIVHTSAYVCDHAGAPKLASSVGVFRLE